MQAGTPDGFLPVLQRDSENYRIQERCNAILVICAGNLIGSFQNFRSCIAHGHARTGLSQHGNIICAVAESDSFFFFQAQIFCEKSESMSLCCVGCVHFYINRKRRGHGALREEPGDGPERFFSCSHIRKIELQFLRAVLML